MGDICIDFNNHCEQELQITLGQAEIYATGEGGPFSYVQMRAPERLRNINGRTNLTLNFEPAKAWITFA